MKILVLNGSPHPQGSTKDMVNAFKKGAESAEDISLMWWMYAKRR